MICVLISPWVKFEMLYSNWNNTIFNELNSMTYQPSDFFYGSRQLNKNSSQMNFALQRQLKHAFKSIKNNLKYILLYKFSSKWYTTSAFIPPKWALSCQWNRRRTAWIVQYVSYKNSFMTFVRFFISDAFKPIFFLLGSIIPYRQRNNWYQSSVKFHLN